LGPGGAGQSSNIPNKSEFWLKWLGIYNE
jgi:hypothetical protein